MNTKIILRKKTIAVSFPKLMISKTNGQVVLFNEPRQGMVLVRGRNINSFNVGYYEEYFFMDYFTDLDETIEIHND